MNGLDHIKNMLRNIRAYQDETEKAINEKPPDKPATVAARKEIERARQFLQELESEVSAGHLYKAIQAAYFLGHADASTLWESVDGIHEVERLESHREAMKETRKDAEAKDHIARRDKLTSQGMGKEAAYLTLAEHSLPMYPRPRLAIIEREKNRIARLCSRFEERHK